LEFRRVLFRSLSFAISGYNARVSAEENEAMALASAFQRTNLLPTASAQAQAEALLHQYLAARIAFYHEEDYDQRMALRMQSIELQTKMWNFVSAAAKQSPNQLTMSLVALEPGSTEGHAVQRR